MLTYKSKKIRRVFVKRQKRQNIFKILFIWLFIYFTELKSEYVQEFVNFSIRINFITYIYEFETDIFLLKKKTRWFWKFDYKLNLQNEWSLSTFIYLKQFVSIFGRKPIIESFLMISYLRPYSESTSSMKTNGSQMVSTLVTTRSQIIFV